MDTKRPPGRYRLPESHFAIDVAAEGEGEFVSSVTTPPDADQRDKKIFVAGLVGGRTVDKKRSMNRHLRLTSFYAHVST
jgi:hypothetical protein